MKEKILYFFAFLLFLWQECPLFSQAVISSSGIGNSLTYDIQNYTARQSTTFKVFWVYGDGGYELKNYTETIPEVSILTTHAYNGNQTTTGAYARVTGVYNDDDRPVIWHPHSGTMPGNVPVYSATLTNYNANITGITLGNSREAKPGSALDLIIDFKRDDTLTKFIYLFYDDKTAMSPEGSVITTRGNIFDYVISPEISIPKYLCFNSGYPAIPLTPWGNSDNVNNPALLMSDVGNVFRDKNKYRKVCRFKLSGGYGIPSFKSRSFLAEGGVYGRIIIPVLTKTNPNASGLYGHTFSFAAVLTSSSGGNESLESSAIVEVEYVDSFDPNGLKVDKKSIKDCGENPEELIYTVEFENIGTGEEDDIAIDVEMDPSLDINSLQLMRCNVGGIEFDFSANADEEQKFGAGEISSLTYHVAGNQLQLKITNANLWGGTLTDLADKDKSRGWIEFSANTITGKDFSSIDNAAKIRFGTNEAIETNHAITNCEESSVSSGKCFFNNCCWLAWLGWILVILLLILLFLKLRRRR
ncbi:MAG: hypothetical protein H7X71_06115 [Chitinophagales bacterium]|nr:hypothetical protein [Chitinophagales bacterium]